MNTTKKDVIAYIKAFIKLEDTQSDFIRYKNKDLLKLKKLLSKYVYLGGKFPPKYKLNTYFYVSPDDIQYVLKSKDIIYAPIGMMGDNVVRLLYDIYKGKVQLNPTKHFKQNELDKLLGLIKKFVEVDKEYAESHKKLNRIIIKFSKTKSFYTAHYRIYKFMLNILEGDDNAEISE